MFARNRLAEAMLDRCVDALIAGDDWRAAAPDPSVHPDVSRLMVVAEWLIELGRRQPQPKPLARERVWGRVRQEIDLHSQAEPSRFRGLAYGPLNGAIGAG